MGSGNFYAQPANTKRNVKGNRFLRSFLFAGVLLMGLPFVSKAINTAPVFVTSSTQLAVCQNSPAVDLSTYLAINDPNTGDLETWSVVSGPSSGALAGFNYTAMATGVIL